MPVRHGKNTRVLLDQYDVSPYLNTVGYPSTQDLAEVTVFGGTTAAPAVDKQYVTGLQDVTVQAGGFFDGSVNAVDDLFSRFLGDDANADHIFTVASGGGVGFRTRQFLLRETQYQVGAPVTGAVAVALNGNGIGGPDAGVVLLDPTLSTDLATMPFSYATVDNTYRTGQFNISSGSMAGATATFVTASPHTMVVGQQFLVSGVTGVLGYNTTWTVATVNIDGVTITATAPGVSGLGAGTFTVAKGAPVSFAGGGVAHLHVISNTANGTINVSVQHSNDGSTWNDLGGAPIFANVATGASAARGVVAPLTGVQRYLRVRVTAGTATTGLLVAALAFARR